MSRPQSRRTARGRYTQQALSLHLPPRARQVLHDPSANTRGAPPQWTVNSVTDGQYSLLWYFLVGPQCHFWSFFPFTILSSAKAEPAYSHSLILAQTSVWVNSFFFFSWGHCKKNKIKKVPCFLLPAGLLSLPEPVFESRQVSAISPAQ